ncbi:MAG: cytochrome c biogenesis protein CcsA [Chloroflexi bacterium]|nr:cytochrome c biogenesis protein CcsA [Chloroflexota bacterium]
MNRFKQSLVSAQLFLLALTAVLAILVFAWLRPAAGFQNPSAARIVVLHVPMAWLATLGFIVSAVYAYRHLTGRRLDDDDASAAASELGLICCVLATATGSIFARTQWGSWWNWDPRETSIFFLLLIYGAYFALRGSVEDPARRALFASVYALLACLVMPFLVFVLPRVFESLHPSRARMAPSYWLVLAAAFFGFLFFLTWIFRIRCAMGRCRLASQTFEDASGPVLRPVRIQHSDR